MASGTTLRRLKKEYATLDKDRPPGVLIVRPLETNCLHAHFLLGGEAFYDTPYEGGIYHGVLQFPREYPMKPPAVIMRTPSGRFQPDKKICFSLSDYHPELWNPMWNIGTILTGLVSFMNSEEITTGGISASASVRREFAQNSLKHVTKQDYLAKETFGNASDKIVPTQAKNGNAWPPVRPPPTKQAKPSVVTEKKSSSASRRGQKAKPKAAPKAVERMKEETESEPEQPTSTAAEATTGKNAAKNRKKREREKRKKRASSFLSNLREQTPQFLQGICNALDGMHVDVSDYHADHVCWRMESLEEYLELVTALETATDDVSLLIESEIGGRSIATFELLESIYFGDGRSMSVVEIPAPKEGRPYQRGLEHVEFVVGGDKNETGGTILLSGNEQKLALEDFMNKNPGADWCTKAIDKPLNPDVSLQIELEDFGPCTVKFHLMSLSKVIEYEKDQGS